MPRSATSVEEELLKRIKDADPNFLERLIVRNPPTPMGYGGSQEDAGEAIGKLAMPASMASSRRIDSVSMRSTCKPSAGRPSGGRRSRRSSAPSPVDTHSEATDHHLNLLANARAYVGGIAQRIVLIDGRQLALLMVDFGVGVVAIGSPYVLKWVDRDFFGES